MSSQINFMIDIETLSTDTRATVLSVGVCAFSFRKGFIAQKEWVIDADYQMSKLKRVVDSQTLLWWSKQKSEVFAKAMEGNALPIGNFIDGLEGFIEDHCSKTKNVVVWGNGANFDIVILETLMKDYYQREDFDPVELWKFWNIQCFRTFNRFTNCKKLVERTGTFHRAVDDARYQAQCVVAKMNPKVVETFNFTPAWS